MKKVFTVVLVICCLYCATSTLAANASTETELSIASLAKEDSRVVCAVAVVEKRICVVALQTKGFASKSQYDKFTAELTKKIADNFEIDNVYISRNPKVMIVAKQIAQANLSQRQQIIEQLVKQLSNYPTTLPMP